jgi:hypothetical protein
MIFYGDFGDIRILEFFLCHPDHSTGFVRLRGVASLLKNVRQSWPGFLGWDFPKRYIF